MYIFARYTAVFSRIHYIRAIALHCPLANGHEIMLVRPRLQWFTLATLV